MIERTDISDLTNELCRRLGIPPHRTCLLEIAPMTVRALTLRENKSGNPYIDPSTNRAAVREHSFEVRT